MNTSSVHPIIDQILKSIPTTLPEVQPVRESIKKVTAEIREAAHNKGNWDAALSILMLHWAQDRERLEKEIIELKAELKSQEDFLDSIFKSS